MATIRSSNSKVLEDVFNHVALPPRLPGRQDVNIPTIERDLVDRLLDASSRMPSDADVESLRRSLETARRVNLNGSLNKNSLLDAFYALNYTEFLLVHVSQQNAALIIRREKSDQGDEVVFEVLEASAISENVLAAKGPLQWDFPGNAVAIPVTNFNEPKFQDELASFLEKASTESIKQFAAQISKAGSLTYESRNTVDPAIITSMLMTILECIGRRVFPILLRKNVRDEVSWDNGAAPWRRCPFWLVLRVAMQRHFLRTSGEYLGRMKYKVCICFLLARLLDDCAAEIHSELSHHLKAKLCRRIIKLECEQDTIAAALAIESKKLLGQSRPVFEQSVSSASEQINSAWESTKTSLKRGVSPLPQRWNDCKLQLKCSKSYFKQFMVTPRYPTMKQSDEVRSLPEAYRHTARCSKPAMAFANFYFMLAEAEIGHEQALAECDGAPPTDDYKQNCLHISILMETYLNNVGTSYDSNPEQKSVMLLTVMEMWMRMDSNAVKAFAILGDYNTGFPAQILDVLQLPRRGDMIRLQHIREYIQMRAEACKYPKLTIFSSVQKGCFAERFYDNSTQNDPLLRVHEKIEEKAARKRAAKMEELQTKSLEYEDISRELMATTVIPTSQFFGISVLRERMLNALQCNRTMNGLHIMTHADDICRHCQLISLKSKCTIAVHEHPLPADPSQAKAAVFEIACPESLHAYRKVTWRILGSLGLSNPLSGDRPRMLFRNYQRFEKFIEKLPRFNDGGREGFVLASTSKSFRITHYTILPLPTTVESVCKPNGLHLDYYDTRHRLWPGHLYEKPTFAHHCRMQIPSTSPFALFNHLPNFDAVSMGPSSNEIIASQTKCPAGSNVHEFIAFQTLFAGKARRWPQLLVELGSSNVNFDTEAVVSLVRLLILQAGPGTNGSCLGIVHAVFEDPIFCKNLMHQLDQRLEAISTNWRDTNSMESLITMGLRMFELGVGMNEQAIEFIQKARTITKNWVATLRSESHQAADAGTALQCSRYALWAALLCRRTFNVFLDAKQVLNGAALECFIQSSVALHDNLGENPSMLTQTTKDAVIRDLKMVSALKYVLSSSFKSNEETLVASVIGFGQGGRMILPRRVASVVHLPEPDDRWIQIELAANSHLQKHIIHFNFLEGHLLVMGQPLGKPPPEWAKSNVVHHLFGNLNLLAFPSHLPGMTYTLAVPMNGHQIHLGRRSSQFIVKACLYERIFEFIPSQVFSNGAEFDLPADLIDDCIHWLDIRTGIIEIRPRRSMWTSKAGNWRLDITSHEARTPSATLVDPYSTAFKLVAKQFSDFELIRQITVYQPRSIDGRLTVKLRRLELLFFVNRRGLLECSQLRAEIDPNQDAGTWYGLRSALVLRDVARQTDPSSSKPFTIPLRQRSVLVPMGVIHTEKLGQHISMTIENYGEYGRYIINDVLGRVECAAEPRLLYLKAAYHAFTSFVIPDPLTGRTGTEEALHCLRSGYCQPWTPLAHYPHEALRLISGLTPLREYYPPNFKTMQHTTWNKTLTTTIQNDAYRFLVDDILETSEQLSKFALVKIDLVPLNPAGPVHLILRSQLRRQCYQRPAITDIPLTHSKSYAARDALKATRSRVNVAECINLLRTWPGSLNTTRDFAGLLQEWSNFQGYASLFDKCLLTDILDVGWQNDWGSLANLCRKSTSKDVYRLMFLLGLVSFSPQVNMDAVRTLIALATIADLKLLIPPVYPAYFAFRHNHVPDLAYIVLLLKPCLIVYAGDERTTAAFNISLKMRRRLEALELAHTNQLDKDTRSLADFLLRQWPCAEPSLEGFSIGVLIDMNQAIGIIRQEWLRLFQNFELSDYVSQVQLALNKNHCSKAASDLADLQGDGSIFKAPSLNPCLLALPERLCLVTSEAFAASPVEISRMTDRQDHTQLPVFKQLLPIRKGIKPPLSPPAIETQQLHSLVAELTQSESAIRRQYGEDLGKSVAALKHYSFKVPKRLSAVNPNHLLAQIADARLGMHRKLQNIQSMLIGQTNSHCWHRQGALWPPVTSISLLETLRSTSKFRLPSATWNAIMDYALSITALQRLLRLEVAFQKGSWQRLAEEQENIGHHNWHPSRHPDWVLLEIDSNILIRPVQVDVALATISPSSESNSVLQMNMGQGKTSCIIPMAAAVLADSKNLLRVVVPKSLLLQTAQLLHTRLGGLIGRELRHIPFSRKTSTSSDTIGAFLSLHRAMQESSGVIIALPEHLLSFKLSGLQRLSDGLLPAAKEMIEVQRWLSQVSRDIIDECDSILSLRTQLIYPSGSQKTVDGHPIRWELTEIILGRVDGHLHNLQKSHPQSLEIIRREHGGFPVMFFLRKDAEDELVARLIDDIYRGRTSIFPADCPQCDRQIIREYISQAKIKKQTCELVSKMFEDNPALRQSMHLLRGLFVHRILLMTLKKRWNVQYGLHPTRDPIAVPFYAKGTPSDQAEWGHPDVAILFTCLAFYYDGLSLVHLGQTLEHVLKCDDPSQVYDRFAQKSALPDALKEWTAINVDDKIQLAEILTYLRYNTLVINYFLNNFVFPRHAKQFRVKLQASGWDIPLASANQNMRLTTGFSGTNDSKRMLPLTIRQHDLDGLTHTNAEVLTYLLRNQSYILAANTLGRHISETDLLRKIFEVQGPRIRVLIDAGAQILGMKNVDLVRAWLEIDKHAQAGVFFDETSRPMVIYRNNSRQTPLVATPFVDDLSDCLVYMDQAHTRGTDLKLPADARGALTLGIDQSKDHTVQAAMRLRQLGTTQSIMFFAPPEVNQSILDHAMKISSESVTSYDIVRWLLEQTCRGMEQLQPLYISQGTDFCRRAQAELDNPHFLIDPTQRESYIKSLRQVEQQTLEHLYGPNTKGKAVMSIDKYSPELHVFVQQLDIDRKGYQDNGNAVHGSALQEVEQEREVAYEVETVREVQVPVHYAALKCLPLHRDLLTFANTGRLAADSAAYEPAFAAMQRYSICKKFGVSCQGTSGNLYVSSEFTRTIKVRLGDSAHDDFQRPVHWLLYNTISEVAIILVPEEVETLLPIVRNAVSATSHILSYAAPITRKMLYFNNLGYYVVPSLPLNWGAPIWFRVELGIYAGRLYFDFTEYSAILAILGVQENANRIEEEEFDDFKAGEEDDAHKPDIDNRHVVVSKAFTRKPLAFLQEWLAIRRKGQDFAETPMGYICQGKQLSINHPFFSQRDAEGPKKALFAKVSVSHEEIDDDDGHFGLDHEDYDPFQKDHDNFDYSTLETSESVEDEGSHQSGSDTLVED